MRSEQLEYVAAVARFGSYRRAAAELHISQPALSMAVRNLERELGVTILERGRSGAQVSEAGRELLPLFGSAIESIDQLRRAAGDQRTHRRVVRVGTVNAGTVPLLTTAIGAFAALHPATRVEVVGTQEAMIDAALREGSLDLGLISCLRGDDMPPELETKQLLSGRAVVCLRADNPLAAMSEISLSELLSQPLILMRSGYLMHRYLHRLLDGRQSVVSYETDGGEMGKLMVAEGLGLTVLPDFSVVGDPLERAGVITCRPLRDDTEVRLMLRRRRSDIHPIATRDLHRLFLEEAAKYSGPTYGPAQAEGHRVDGRGLR
jgi:DNA-binding transcriptional LysR family regulator